MIGLAKNIGVSNFRIMDLERILKVAKYKPAMNQIEYHPYLQQDKLRQFHAEHGIITTGYGPLVPLRANKDGPLIAVIQNIATKQSKTPDQVTLLIICTNGRFC